MGELSHNHTTDSYDHVNLQEETTRYNYFSVEGRRVSLYVKMPLNCTITIHYKHRYLKLKTPASAPAIKILERAKQHFSVDSDSLCLLLNRPFRPRFFALYERPLVEYCNWLISCGLTTYIDGYHSKFELRRRPRTLSGDSAQLRINALEYRLSEKTVCAPETLKCLILSENSCFSFSSSFLSRLSALEILSVTNSLRKEAPPLGQIASLRTLSLAGNRIKRLDWLHCTHLRELDLSNNGISALPRLPSTLERLNLAYNNLSASLDSLKKLKSLASLDLSYNLLFDFSVQQPLSVLSLRGNRLSRFVSTTVYASLDLSHNKLVLLEARAETINCSYNRLKCLDLDCSYLDCSYNELSELKIKSAIEINASYNKLKTFVKLDSTKVRSLNLSNNEISFVNEINAPYLVELDVSNNDLHEFPSFAYSRNLTVLKLQNNKLKAVQQEIWSLPLRVLLLSNNSLTTFPLPEDSKKPSRQHSLCFSAQTRAVENRFHASTNHESLERNTLYALTTLDVSFNLLTSSFLELLPVLSALRMLNVSHNKLLTFQLHSDALEELYVSHCQLSQLNVHAPRLKTLIASNNRLSQPVTLPSTVKIVDLSYNEILALKNTNRRILISDETACGLCQRPTCAECEIAFKNKALSHLSFSCGKTVREDYKSLWRFLKEKIRDGLSLLFATNTAAPPQNTFYVLYADCIQNQSEALSGFERNYTNRLISACHSDVQSKDLRVTIHAFGQGVAPRHVSALKFKNTKKEHLLTVVHSAHKNFSGSGWSYFSVCLLRSTSLCAMLLGYASIVVFGRTTRVYRSNHTLENNDEVLRYKRCGCALSSFSDTNTEPYFKEYYRGMKTHDCAQKSFESYPQSSVFSTTRSISTRYFGHGELPFRCCTPTIHYIDLDESDYAVLQCDLATVDKISRQELRNCIGASIEESVKTVRDKLVSHGLDDSSIHLFQINKLPPKIENECSPPYGSMAVLFSDIENSTRYWTQSERLMRCATEMHNELFRKIIEKYNGYEVKTEGDAFMIAFKSTHDAVSAALSFQNQLVTLDWPPELSNENVSFKQSALENYTEGEWLLPGRGRLSSYAPRQSSLPFIFRGLRVRIGINFGVCFCEIDETSQKIDYFGTNVIHTTRLCSSAKGGQILVSKSVYEELIRTRDKKAEQPVYVVKETPRLLKGLGIDHEIYAIYSEDLYQREGYFRI